MKLLLHTCCGPCFLGAWGDLQSSDLEITNYFYNPNIQPGEEYVKRRQNLARAIAGKTAGILEETYDPGEHSSAISKNLSFPERCKQCYRLRLEKTAQRAKNEGYQYFSTTLLVSPYQNHDFLKKLGEELAQKYQVNFYYKDLRSYFRSGQTTAKNEGIYRQKYCGCLLSRENK